MPGSLEVATFHIVEAPFCGTCRHLLSQGCKDRANKPSTGYRILQACFALRRLVLSFQSPESMNVPVHLQVHKSGYLPSTLGSAQLSSCTPLPFENQGIQVSNVA